MSDSSKFSRGMTFRTHLYVHNIGSQWLFQDSPHCPVEYEAWEARGLARDALSDHDRLQDSIREHFPSEPKRGYNPSCECDVCKHGFLSRYFKGLLGSPAQSIIREGGVDPRFTVSSVKDHIKAMTESYRKLPPSDIQQLNVAIESIKNKSNGVWLFDLPNSRFDSIIFKLVRELWVEDISSGVFYCVNKERSSFLNKHQPNWASIYGIDEVAELQRDQELASDVYSRRLVTLNAPGPFTEAQAMMVFGCVRSAASKGATVVVNTDDSTLRGYVIRLKKQLE